MTRQPFSVMSTGGGLPPKWRHLGVSNDSGRWADWVDAEVVSNEEISRLRSK